ncbi:hypothetical protein [Paenibacillus azoreducens]|uniref:Uncharacterized protein n=1 Tax=Paenibacillus azoreducens TaxID=116718 RepID=A0A919YC91_9BACL|nr:hypothetical protein [Paenibacillus azoreducens]GIO46355.1 hypothetical protein J34TS1_11200 [Paenibacillus azoreducens]
MNLCIFAGICDKSEMLMYVCKLLASAEHSVLLVDATEKRKYPYYIGRLDEQLQITDFSGFDVACGFEDATGLEAYLHSAGGSLEKYDYVIFDLELPDFCSSEIWRKASALIWVTDYGIWTLEKGSCWLEAAVHRHFGAEAVPEFNQVVIHAVDDWFGSTYLEGYFNRLPVYWLDDPVIIPWNELDFSLKLQNEHMKKVRMKPLTRGYKRNLCLLMQKLTDWDQKQMNRILRIAERSKT